MITHRPKGSMCMNCKPEVGCPKPQQFPHMKAIDKDADGMIVVRCTHFKRVKQ